MWRKFQFFEFFETFNKMWGKFQNKFEISINFEKNKIFGTRNDFQKSFRNDVLPTRVFRNRQNRKGEAHKNVEMSDFSEVNVG